MTWLLAFVVDIAFFAAIFMALELIAMRDKTDSLFTLSTYIKAWERRHGILGRGIVAVTIAYAAVWLFGHLVLEWW